MALFLRTHGPDECSGEHCCIHNPSNHPLRDAPMHWRSDKHVMERICEHGIGHADPDDVAHRKRMGVERAGVHGCDGCCWKEDK